MLAMKIFSGGYIYWYFNDGTSERSNEQMPKANAWNIGGYSPIYSLVNASDRYLIGFEAKQDPHESFTRITAGLKPLKLDGTFVGSQLPIYGDAQVTGPTKSGTGTFGFLDGSNKMVVNNSNGQWVDNGNYYVKAFNTFLKEGSARDEATFQAIANAFAAYPGAVQERKAAITQLVDQVSATLSTEDEALLREIVDLD